MNENRINVLFNPSIVKKNDYVVYWMEQSQRVHYNHALSYAIEEANKYQVPLLVLFVINPRFKGSNSRHLQFMLEGLKEVKLALEELHISFVLKIGTEFATFKPILEKAQTLVMDAGFLKNQKIWRDDIAYSTMSHFQIKTVIVESDVVVPVKIAAKKVMYSARSIRKSLFDKYQLYLNDFTQVKVYNKEEVKIKSETDLNDIKAFIETLPIDKTVMPSESYIGGRSAAIKQLNEFIAQRLFNYVNSNDPSTFYTSRLSMYLHYGQISSIEIIKEVLNQSSIYDISQDNIDGYIEQLLVRRELAYNYVSYQKNYDQFEFSTEKWAYQTMEKHLFDYREYLYTRTQYEAFETHDPYFNAAMKEMIKTGYMHNYMRMYWAKKIIEWSATYSEAFYTIQYLNDKYFIDGRDANGYASIAWCFGKHDRAWGERPIFGKLRYMNANGLKRKFNIEQYVEDCNNL